MKCASCRAHQCVIEDAKNFKGCPTQKAELMERALEEMQKEENLNFYQTGAKIEKEGYGIWSRARETMEFAKKMG